MEVCETDVPQDGKRGLAVKKRRERMEILSSAPQPTIKASLSISATLVTLTSRKGPLSIRGIPELTQTNFGEIIGTE